MWNHLWFLTVVPNQMQSDRARCVLLFFSSFFLVIDLTTEIANAITAAFKALIDLMVEYKSIIKLYEKALICGKSETMFCYTKKFLRKNKNKSYIDYKYFYCA